MKQIACKLLCVGLLSSPIMADIFDENREGFIVGLAVGLTSVSTEVDFTHENLLDERSIGLATSFKLGYAFNEQFLLYYTNQVDWYSFNDSSTRVGITGIGVDYYIAPTSGLYTTAMLGFGSFSGVTHYAASTGYAFSLGVGYDLLPHMRVGTEYMHINIDENYANISSNSLRLKFEYTWY